jgi:3-isopropylmalate/(R)-2-methylmalate dehydratase small subunit
MIFDGEATVLEGRVWKFGDNIDTDAIVPGRYLVRDLPEIAEHVLEGVRPEFAADCAQGDIIVGGRNFGTGSSREMAPRGIQAVGITAVVAKSFARIFFRNCVNVGLAPIECPDAGSIEEGQRVSIDVEAGIVTVLETGRRLEAVALPDVIAPILRAGGMENYLAMTLSKRQTRSEDQL